MDTDLREDFRVTPLSNFLVVATAVALVQVETTRMLAEGGHPVGAAMTSHSLQSPSFLLDHDCIHDFFAFVGTSVKRFGRSG